MFQVRVGVKVRMRKTGKDFVKKNSGSYKTWNFMLQSLFLKENLNTMTLNPISTRKLKSEPDPTRPNNYNHMLTRTKPTFSVCTPVI